MNRKEMLLDFRYMVDGNRAVGIQIDGVLVCTKFLNTVLNVSNTLRSSVLGLPSATSSHIPGRIGGGNSSETKQIGIIAFLNKLVELVGDSMSHSRERHLPHKCKKLVYLLYYDEEVSQGRRPGTASSFYATWKKFVPHIKCVRAHTFETCDACITFRDNQMLIIRGRIVGDTKASLISAFNRHISDVKQQRAEYRRVRQMAFDRPGDVLSVIIDGADQAKFGLPRFVDKSKNERGHALKQKVTGVLFHHGLVSSDFFAVFTSRENIPGGANQTIDVMVRSLLALLKRRSLRDSFRTHAKELFVQLDNTAKDNKNRFFFAFCDHLVFLGIFRSVTINFLPVGHTHEDIDRNFSRISLKLAQENIATVSELHAALRTSERGVYPMVVRATGHLNYSGCLTEQSCVVRNQPGISTYRKFVFNRNKALQTKEGQRFTVSCRVGYKMTTPAQELQTLPFTDGSIGSFLMKEPDMTRIPAVNLKRITIVEANQYRMRIRSTESRIRSEEKVQSLLTEVDSLQCTSTAMSEWDFSELKKLQGVADLVEDCDNLSEPECPDGLSYDVGEMVTVRTSNGAITATPFWVGCVIEVKTSRSSSSKLFVLWYMLQAGARGEPRGADYCFKGQYKPCDENQVGSCDEIPSESVYCSFPSLSANGCIPLRAQQRTRQAISESIQEVQDPFSHVGEHNVEDDSEICNALNKEEEDSGAIDEIQSHNRGNEDSRRSITPTDFARNSMVTVRCPEADNAPFWVGKIMSITSSSKQNMKVKWYKPIPEPSSRIDYYNSPFKPDSESAITTISASSVIKSFKSLTKNGRLPKNVQTLTREGI